MKHHVLGREALEFIRSETERFPDRRGLRHLLHGSPIEHGSVLTFLPSLPPAHLFRSHGADVFRHSASFYHGGIERADQTYRARELGFIGGWLRKGAGHLALFQTDYFRFTAARQPYRLAPGERVLLCDSPNDNDRGFEGWVVLDGGEVTDEEIDLAISRGMSPYPPTFGLLTSCTTKFDAAIQSHVVDEAIQRELAAGVQAIIVGAFDGEALLFWQTSTGSSARS
jgi:hypothetical protein